MFSIENHVRDAVEKVGGATKASNACSVSNAAIYKWIAARRVPDIDNARRLAKLAKVPVGKLRPV